MPPKKVENLRGRTTASRMACFACSNPATSAKVTSLLMGLRLDKESFRVSCSVLNFGSLLANESRVKSDFVVAAGGVEGVRVTSSS